MKPHVFVLLIVTSLVATTSAGRNTTSVCGPRNCFEATFCFPNKYRDGIFRPVLNLDETTGTKSSTVECDIDNDKVWTTLLTRSAETIVSETNFERSPADYRHGFGDARNSWLGARRTRQLVFKKHRTYRIRVVVDGVVTATCHNFRVGDSSTGYKATFKDCSGRDANTLELSDEREFTKDCDKGQTWWWFDEECSVRPNARTTKSITWPLANEITSLVIQFRQSGQQRCFEECATNGRCQQVCTHTHTHIYIYI